MNEKKKSHEIPIHIFICENPELAKKLIEEHFDHEAITYVETFDHSQRAEVVQALKTIGTEDPDDEL